MEYMHSQLVDLTNQQRKSTGSHYTPTVLADFVVRQIIKVWADETQNDELYILDPAVGDGELLFSLIQGLSEYQHIHINAHGFDTSEKAISIAVSRLQKAFSEVQLTLSQNNFLDVVLDTYSSDAISNLFDFLPVQYFDLVIANPPYVRTQVMGAKQAQTLTRKFGLSGRVDLYHAFIEGIARVLHPGGIAGIIVSNRFMTTKSGIAVREGIKKHFDILHVWDLGDTRLFDAAVLPAVLILRKKDGYKQLHPPKFTSIYSISSDGSVVQQARDVVEALELNGIIEIGCQFYQVQQGMLNQGDKHSDVWRIETTRSSEWLSTVEAHTFCNFSDIGKIRVGVKTTADKIFIRSDWEEMPEEERPELLRPLITHHIARRFKALQPSRHRQILYTHDVVQGKRVAVNVSSFPRSARYLNKHREILEKREYVMQSGRNWYEIWVPQDPEAWSHPKIVFRDIAETPTFWIDFEGSIVNGDCYWMIAERAEQTDFLWLALAVGNSSFIETFYDHRFNNKLYAGRRRFITQYVEKFPLPNPHSEIGQAIIQKAKEIYKLLPSDQAESLEKELNQLVWLAFGLSIEKVIR